MTLLGRLKLPAQCTTSNNVITVGIKEIYENFTSCDKFRGKTSTGFPSHANGVLFKTQIKTSRWFALKTFCFALGRFTLRFTLKKWRKGIDAFTVMICCKTLSGWPPMRLAIATVNTRRLSIRGMFSSRPGQLSTPPPFFFLFKYMYIYFLNFTTFTSASTPGLPLITISVHDPVNVQTLNFRTAEKVNGLMA